MFVQKKKHTTVGNRMKALHKKMETNKNSKLQPTRANDNICDMQKQKKTIPNYRKINNSKIS